MGMSVIRGLLRHRHGAARAAVAALLASLLVAGGRCRADLVVGTASSTVDFKPWNSLTASVDLRVTNTGASTELVNIGQVGFVLVPVTVDSGSLSLSFTLPTSNPLIADNPDLTWVPGVPLSPAVTIGGTAYGTYDLGIVGENDPGYNNQVLAGAYANLATLQFTALDEDTSGTWQFYAVNTADLLSGWGTTVYDADTALYNIVFSPFGNVPQADGTAVLLTTITVPEPSTWWMAGTAGFVAVTAARRRKYRHAGSPAPTPAA